MVLAAAVLLAGGLGIEGSSLFAVASLVAMVAAGIPAVVVKPRADRHYRAKASDKTGAGPQRADTGMILGDARCPPTVAHGDAGALLVVATGERNCTRNGLGIAQHPATDQNAWRPWPALTITVHSARSPGAPGATGYRPA